ncbi:MAG: ABC transporter permease [Clostridia bacterium]|nr:ABC transporter permease [Clostridia bacterium]
MRKTFKTFTLAKRNMKEIVRDPLSLIFLIALPLLLEVLFYCIFHDLTPQFDMKNLAPGIVVFSQSFLTLFTGLLIATDRNTAFLTRLYVCGARSHEFIFGYTIAMIPLTLVQTVLFFIVGGIIDPSILGVGMLRCIPIALLSSILFIGLGILFGSICSEKSIGGVSSAVITGQSVLSGMWFPIEGLNPGMVTVMKCLPFKNATDVMRLALTGGGDPVKDHLVPILIVAAYAVAALVGAIFAFRSKMRSKNT